MALDPADLAAIVSAIQGQSHPCTCGLDTETAKQAGHWWGMVQDLGDGDTRRGIERMRTGFNALRRWDRWAGRIGWVVIATVVSALSAGGVGLVWLGFKAKTGS